MPTAVKAAIAPCPFVVVSDIESHTDTTRLAHVLLPATGWGEKSGTVTNSERRISRQRAFLPSPGQTRPDWWQMTEVARRMGFSHAFPYENAAGIFAEHASLSGFENGGERDFDISAHGEDNEGAYDAMEPFQWPQPKGQPSQDTRFFADGRFYHSDGKARFIATPAGSSHRTDVDFPLVLNTGRIRDHWHTMTRTGKSARLSAHIAEPFAEIHPLDAANRNITHADLVELRAGNGARVLVRALLSARQSRGSVFVPMHWTGETASLARVDALIPPVTDPVSGQPALKHVAVSMARYAAGAHAFAVSAQKPVCGDATYWALAKTDGGFRIELAFDEPIEDWETWARRSFAIAKNADLSGYADHHGGDTRLAFFVENRLVCAMFVARTPVSVSRNWIVAQLGQAQPDSHRRNAIVAGRPSADRPDPGATVCSCFGVGVNQIATAARNGCATVDAIGTKLGAGSNCGSCRPEIRRILDATTIDTNAVIAAE